MSAAFEQIMPCDLSIGFSLDVLLDIINHTYGETTINIGSIDTISPSYRSAFKDYFITKYDKVIVHQSHAINAIDTQQLEMIAWGNAILRGGTKSYVLKLSHNYFLKPSEQDQIDGKFIIQLDYNGTEVHIVEGDELDHLPKRMIRQAIQTSFKHTKVPSISIDTPTINIPFADTAVDLQNLTINNQKKKSKRKDHLYFEIVIDDEKYTIGKFITYGSASFDLNLTYLLKKDDNPLHIAIKGLNCTDKNSHLTLLGKAKATHNKFEEKTLSSTLIGESPEVELEVYENIIDAHIKHTYGKIEDFISPILECFGSTLSTSEQITNIVCKKIHDKLLSLRPSYKLDYRIRHLTPIDISVESLGVSFNPNTNSLCLNFNYIIDKMDENTQAITTTPSFVYPYGLGFMVSEQALQKIFKAYWDHSHILRKTICSNYDLLTRQSTDLQGFSLNISKALLNIDSSIIQIVATMKPLSIVDNSPSKSDGCVDKTPKNTSMDSDSQDNTIEAVIGANINLSNNNELNVTLNNVELNTNTSNLDKIAKDTNSLKENVNSIFFGTKIDLLNLPKTITIGKRSFDILYNYKNVNPNAIIISSKIDGLKRSNIKPKPSLLASRKEFTLISFVPKDKWGYEGTSKGNFNIPCGMTIFETDNEFYIYVVDRDNNRIQKLNSRGKCLVCWGSKGSDNGQFNYPIDLTLDKNGNVYVVDSMNNKIQIFKPDGSFSKTFGSKGNGKGQFLFPQGIAIDQEGSIFVTDTNHLIQKFDSNGNFIRQWGGPGNRNGQFYSPKGLSVNKRGILFVADSGNHQIQTFSTDGKFLNKWGNNGNNNGQFSFPQGIAFDKDENIYVLDTGNNRVQVFNPKFKYFTKISGTGSSIGNFMAPFGIAIDKHNDIYITDSLNNRIQKFGL